MTGTQENSLSASRCHIKAYQDAANQPSKLHLEIDHFLNSWIGETSRKTTKTNKRKKPWYDHTCRQLKKQLQELVKKINLSSHQSLRQDYFFLKKKYKKHVKMMHKRYKKQIVNEINALHPKRSQDFWRYINQLRKSDAVEEETYVLSEDWICNY